MNWFYALNGKQTGPIAESDLARLASAKLIDSTTLVWREGLPDWQPLGVALPALAVGADAPQLGGVAVPAAQKDLYVQQMREGVFSTAPGMMRFGGFWIRFVARFVDGIILRVVGFVIGLAAGTAASGNGDSAGLGTGTAVFLVVANMAIAFGYETFMVGKFGATLGKMAVGLKVVRADGSPVSMGLAAGRYFAVVLSSLTFLIGFIMAAFDDQKRALHDRICNTRVIKIR